MKFHEKLSELRHSRGLSQEALGREVMASRQTVSKWETGQSYPDFESLVMLSDFFGLSLDELVKDIDVQGIRKHDLVEEKVVSLSEDVEKAKGCLSLAGAAVFLLVILGILFALVSGIPRSGPFVKGSPSSVQAEAATAAKCAIMNP